MNKRAQISETMTWVIATIIIVFILVVSVVITSIVGLAKGNFATTFKKDNLIPTKSLSGFLLTKDLNASGKIIFDKLKEDEEFIELNGINGLLASKIFNNFYDENFYEIWLGIGKTGFGANVNNDYFGSYGKIVAWESENQGNRLCSRIIFTLEKDKKWVKLELCD